MREGWIPNAVLKMTLKYMQKYALQIYTYIYSGGFLDAVEDGKDLFWCLRLMNTGCVSSEPTTYSSLRGGIWFRVFK